MSSKEHPAPQNMEILLFYIFVGNFCRPGSGSGSSNQNKCESMRIRIHITSKGRHKKLEN